MWALVCGGCLQIIADVADGLSYSPKEGSELECQCPAAPLVESLASRSDYSMWRQRVGDLDFDSSQDVRPNALHGGA